MNDFEPNDEKLAALFAREHTHIPAEPFAGATLARVAAERRRTVAIRRALQVLSLILLVAVGPWLIAASVWISGRMDTLFAWASDRPAVVAVAVLVGAAVFALGRRRVW